MTFWRGLAAVTVLLALAPAGLPPYAMTLLTEALILGLCAMSLDLMVGYTRLLSFGHAAAYGLGAYTCGNLLLHTDIPLVFAVPIAAVFSGVVAIGVAWVCTLASGVSFSMLTLSFAQLLYAVAFKWTSVTGASDGLAGIPRSPGPFDLAIDGSGFFKLVDSQGHYRYTRDGAFSRAADGTLRNAQDLRLAGVRIPADALSATVGTDGNILAKFADGARTIGRIRLAEFPAPERLRALGGAIFEATPDAGKPRDLTPGSDEGPKVRFGMLEESNVTIIDAMMQILTAQRAYEANAKGVQAADEMLRIANNLQRG